MKERERSWNQVVKEWYFRKEDTSSTLFKIIIIPSDLTKISSIIQLKN
jgi:hypothetical protein